MSAHSGVAGWLAVPGPGTVWHARVRAVFARSVHAWGDGRCLTLGDASLPAHPHSILWPGFPGDWAMGQAVAVTSEGVFGPRGRLVSLRSLKRFAPPPACRPLAATGRIAAALAACQARAAAMPARGGFHDVFLGCLGRLSPACVEASQGLPGALAGRGRRLVLALARPLRLRDWDGLAGAGRALAGLGIGLTPAGDDVLAGILASLHYHGACLAQPLLPQARLTALAGDWAGHTTAFSGFLLRGAASGQVAAPVGDWLAAVHAGDATTALRRLGQLESLGHSSGLDTFAGLLLSLQILMGERAWIEA
ncbi:MAG: DUF2877 domain-containing protein [Solidesulfovibrio sp. DCME]|uniref:oxamate carbamoyltransferase subunit AllH family protein n=1 Tax=Solidesulfovibrio sp. DCME TaxID=3447380 RepID=UPI003D0F1D03